MKRDIAKNSITREQFIKKAASRNITIHKNNIHESKPISKICGAIRTKYSSTTEELLLR